MYIHFSTIDIFFCFANYLKEVASHACVCPSVKLNIDLNLPFFF